MRKVDLNLNAEESRVALELVSYVVYHATKDTPDDEDGVFVNVSDFIKFFTYDDLPILIRLVDKYSLYEDLSSKIFDWIAERED